MTSFISKKMKLAHLNVCTLLRLPIKLLFACFITWLKQIMVNFLA